MLTVGTKVKVKNSLVEGTVVGLSLNDAKTELSYLINFTDFDGEEHQRYFSSTQLIVEA
jgi:hypothetical protein